VTVNRRRVGKSGYGYKVDGEYVPGVTKIVGMLPKDNLIDWAARESATEAINCWDELGRLPVMDRYNRIYKARWNKTNPAAKRGTEVHRLAEALGNDEEVSVPPELQGYVEQYQDFLASLDVRPLVGGTELVVASREHLYCGSLDLIADLGAVSYDAQIIPPSRWLLDIKTAESGIWPEAALQCCAYERAEVFVDPADPEDERRVEWLKIAQCGALNLKSDAWELRPLDTSDVVWETFLRLRFLFDRADKDRGDYKSWVGGSARAADLVAN
jgi:hypothetical protein